MDMTYLARNLKNIGEKGRKSQPRKSLKVLEWLAKLRAQMNGCSTDDFLGDYMSLKFVGVFGQNLTAKEVEVQAHLLKIIHNKRKHNSRTAQEMSGTVIVQINPNDSENNGKIPAISIPIDKTKRPNESTHLKLTVKVLEKSSPRLSKRKKIDNIKYESELTVVDKFQRRLLLNGQYDVPLQLAKDLAGCNKTSNMDLLKENKFLCDIQKLPKMRFYLEWTRNKLDGLVDHPATVCINESNNENLPDQNCSGSLQCDTSGLRSLAYLSTGPVRRTVTTEILFCRRNRPKRKLPEFIQIDEFVEVNNDEPFITGDDRLADQSDPLVPRNRVNVEPEDENTISLVSPNEVYIDPEDENTVMPVWLQVKTKTMIDELAGVSEGDKALMKMWNTHIMSCGYYANDIKLRNDWESFIQQKGDQILRMKLYNNFVLFMVILYDRRIISPPFFKKCIERIQEVARDKNIEL